MYSNYNCNIDCSYCLTESNPRSAKRQLDYSLMLHLAQQASDLGFTELGITGGEPFLRKGFAQTVRQIAEVLPCTVLTNATLFANERIALAEPIAGSQASLQISLDSPHADLNDAQRAPKNFALVVEAIPRLVDMGIKVRIATTVEPGTLSQADQGLLCSMHRSWGISDDDHIIRPIIMRGRAVQNHVGQNFSRDQLPPELTIATHGAFWSAFGPTMSNGRPDTSLLITRTIDPLEVPANALLSIVAGRPEGADAQIGIR